MMTEERNISSEILKASRELHRMLSRFRSAQPNLPTISLSLVAKGDEYDDAGVGTANLIITIDADTQEHAEEHAEELVAQGCICTSTGPTTVECDCTGL